MKQVKGEPTVASYSFGLGLCQAEFSNFYRPAKR